MGTLPSISASRARIRPLQGRVGSPVSGGVAPGYFIHPLRGCDPATGGGWKESARYANRLPGNPTHQATRFAGGV
jgi:hypothetical protein